MLQTVFMRWSLNIATITQIEFTKITLFQFSSSLEYLFENNWPPIFDDISTILSLICVDEIINKTVYWYIDINKRRF